MVKRTCAVPMLMLLGCSLGGCVVDDVFTSVQTSFAETPAPVAASQVAATEAAVTPARLAGPGAVPWQLMPASGASIAQGETTKIVDKPGLGRIRGTDKALAQLDQRIVPYKDTGPVVTACKEAFDPQARAAGAYSVEAAAAGPERRGARGKTQQVFFRIFYADPKDNGVEVRQAAIACTVGKGGQLVAASPV